MYPVNPFLEWLYEKSIIIQEFILFKIFRLKEHKNAIGVHFFLNLAPKHIFSFEIYIFRINLYFPFFISISFGILGKKGFQAYFGTKFGVEPTVRYDGEYDYMLSCAFRRIVLEDKKRYEHEGCN